MRLLFLLFFVSCLTTVSAQNLSSTKNHTTLGAGVGLPYGGLGLKFSINPANQLTIFGGLGYNFVDVGFNAGIVKSFKSESRTQFYLTGMFGTNAAILIEGASELNESYFGPTFGAGLKFNSFKRKGNYWDLAILVPITSSKFNDDLDAIKGIGIDIRESWPVLITAGYNFMLGQRE